jgi:hypothetical protein
VIAAAAASLSLQAFRYERTVRPRLRGAALVVADEPMLAHAQPDFADVRIVDAHGRQVPWRRPPRLKSTMRRVALVDVGRRGGTAVARFRNRGILDRIVLDIPDRHFTGTVSVLGSDDRRTWTALSRTEIYSLSGAAPARSTTALLPTTDLRWIELRASGSGITRIDGAAVAARATPTRPTAIPATFAEGVLDLHLRVPVDEVRVVAETPRYARPFRIETGSGAVVASGTLVRAGAARVTVVPLGVRARRLRIVVDNGDDPPLRGLRAVAYARPRMLLVEGGHRGPWTLYYGGALRPPEYDFAQLPVAGLQASPVPLGVERANAAYRVVDTRSVFARHRSLVTAALALAALILVGAGGLALRRT